MSSLILAAAETHSKTPFYFVAGAFAIWAVAIGAIGVSRPAFPNGPTGGRVIMAVSVLLMAATMITAVLTAG